MRSKSLAAADCSADKLNHPWTELDPAAADCGSDKSDHSGAELDRPTCLATGRESSLHDAMEVIDEALQRVSTESVKEPSIGSDLEVAVSSIESDSNVSFSMESLTTSESVQSNEPDNEEVLVDTSLNTIVLLTAIKLKNKMSDIAMIDVLKLLNCIGPDVLPQTNHMIKKMYNNLTSIEIHHICPQQNCGKYLGIINNASDLENSQKKDCDHCGHSFVVKDNIKSENVFLYVSVASQIKDLLKIHGGSLNIYDNKNAARLLDIQDGVKYKETMQINVLTNNRKQLSLSFSCDGVPVFKASGYSIWPILCVLNELVPEVRDKHVMLVSLWFGLKKPNMNVYMLPFARESQTLYESGVNGYTVSVLVGVCDSVARCLVQNSSQFNGEAGCSLCYHPGVVVDKGRGHCRVYEYDFDNVPKLRTHKETLAEQDQALKEEKAIKGMKGPTVLSMVPNFDIVEGLIPDFLHCCLLGIARQFMSIWLDGQNKNEPFYLGQEKIKVIDSCLLAIKPPCTISRTPRPLKERRYWKAHEWYNWLFFYSLPSLQKVLSAQYLNHWALLVAGVYYLIKDQVYKSEI
jgi:hypothetical protein